MPTMKALVATGHGSATIQDVENLPVRDTFVKIKVKAIALNPTDYKHVFSFTKGGEIVGIDICGEVVEIGSKVKTQVNIGDRIAGMVHGCNSYSPRDGGFVEYAEIKDGIFAHIPDSWGWAKAAGLGAGVTTAGQGLFQSLGLPMPDIPTTSLVSVLIYGGSTATGCLAIQFAHLAGFKVITLASPNQFDRLKELGASMCYDYHNPDVASHIRRDTKDGLMYAFDIITSEESMKICAEALASDSKNGRRPRATLLLPDKTFPRDDVDIGFTSGYSVIGETSIKYGNVVEGDPKDYEFGLHLWSLTDQLIQEGRFHPHDIEVRPGGLEQVVSGLEDLREHRVHGHKLVYVL